MPWHKKKPFDELKKGKYTRKDLHEAVILFLKGKVDAPYCRKHYNVSPRTLRRYASKCRQQLQMSKELSIDDVCIDEKGPAPSLGASVESSLKMFIQDSIQIGVPRTKSLFATDVQTYVVQQKLSVPFTDARPGSGFFERFCNNCDGSSVVFHTAEEWNAFMNRHASLEEWTVHVRKYISSCLGHLIDNRKSVIVMEAQSFKTHSIPQRTFTFLVIYNGYGEIVKWVVITDGSQLNDAFAIENHLDLMMLKTTDGSLNATVVRNAFILVQRHLTSENSHSTPLLLMDNCISQEFDYAGWRYLVEKTMYAVSIPRAICTARTTFNSSVMSKYATKMLFIMHTRFVWIDMEFNEFNFMHIHKEVVERVKANKFLGKCIASLRINSFVRVSLPPTEVQVPDADRSTYVQPLAPSSASACTQATSAKRKCRRNKSKKTIAVASVGCATEIGGNLLDYTQDIGTQTDETCFERDYLKEARQNFQVDVIQVQDFESDSE